MEISHKELWQQIESQHQTPTMNDDQEQNLPNGDISLLTTITPETPVSPSSPINLPTLPSPGTSAIQGTLNIASKKFPDNLPAMLGICLDQSSNAIAVLKDRLNPYAVKLNSKNIKNVIREMARFEGITLRRNDVNDLVSDLTSQAEMTGNVTNIWYRVAPVTDGIEIDLCRDDDIRIRITAGKVETIREGSHVVFTRSSTTLPMALPAERGDIELVKKYLNLSHQDRVLLIAWLTYILAHPKTLSTVYPILHLKGGQGSGKSLLCKVIMMLIDPSNIGIRMMPKNERDFAVAAQNSHLLCFDNVRAFAPIIADLLCVASSGGSISSRQLYTDSEQIALNLHSALVLNGIHEFIDQPDLAQRCLTLEMTPLSDDKRRSDRDIIGEFEGDLPSILRGLFDLIARILEVLPNAEVTNPERLFDFSKWLAAMEKADSVPAGVYQSLFSQTLKESQLDCLMDNVLASELVDFSQHLSEPWHGTPAELLAELNRNVNPGTARSRDWPQNPIALSKRLKPLQTGLLSQGIHINFGRGKHRTINISLAR